MKAVIFILLPLLARAQVQCECKSENFVFVPNDSQDSCTTCQPHLDFFGATPADECILAKGSLSDFLENNATEDGQAPYQPFSTRKYDIVRRIMDDDKLRDQWAEEMDGNNKDLPKSVKQLDCFSHGDFLYDSFTCNCTYDAQEPSGDAMVPSFNDATYCSDCAEGRVGFPFCNSWNCAVGSQCNSSNAICSDDGLLTNSDRCDDPIDGPLARREGEKCYTYREDGVNRQRVIAAASIGCGATAECVTGKQFCHTFASKNEMWEGITVYTCQLTGEDTEQCPKYAFVTPAAVGESSGWIQIGVETCMPYEKCCDGECCSSVQSCTESKATVTIRTASWAPLGGCAGDVVFIGSQCLILDTESVSGRYDWKLSSGGTVDEDHREMCMASKSSAPSVVLAYILPIVLLLVTVLSFLIVVMTSGIGSIKVFIPAMLVVFFAILILFSNLWTWALLAVIGALTAIGAQAGTSDNRNIFSAVFQFIIFVLLAGGLGFGQLLVDTPGILSTAEDSTGPGWGPLGVCATYYGTEFTYDNNRPWDSDPTFQHFGLCSLGWQSAVLFFSVMILGFYFVQMVASASLMAGKDN